MNWMDRPSKRAKTQRAQSDRHERDTARAFGHRRSPGSGAGRIKSDTFKDPSAIDEYLPERVECKATSRKSLLLRLDWLCKIAHEASDHGQEPIVALRFEAARGVEQDWIVLRRSTYLEMREQLRGGSE